MNVSPLCNLSSQVKPTKWAAEVTDLYEETTKPEYISSITTPLRFRYPTSRMRNEELMTTLSQVNSVIAQSQIYKSMCRKMKCTMHLREILLL